MTFESLIQFREVVERLVRENRSRCNKRNLIYIEARYENFETPLIYIYVYVPWFLRVFLGPLLRWCRAGFRGAPSLEEFEESISGFGDVSIVCEGLTRCLRQRALRVQVEVVKVGWGHQRNVRIEHDCAVNMGILVLGQHCVRVVVGDEEPRLVCP